MARKSDPTPWLLGRGDRQTVHARMAAGRSPLHVRAAALLRCGAPTGRYNSGAYLWRQFTAFCAQRRRCPLPATEKTVIAFVVQRDTHGKAFSSTRLALSAIRRMHRCAGQRDPTRTAEVREMMAGLRRERGSPPLRYKPCRLSMLGRLIAATSGEGIRCVRDRAILLLLYFGPLQTYEFAALQYEQVTFTDSGMLLRDIGLSYKRTVAVWRGRDPAFCPVAALEAWIVASGVRNGPLFRGIYGEMRKWGKGSAHGNYVHSYTISKHLCQPALDKAVRDAFARIGIACHQGYCVHSLHLGFMLDAIDAGMEWTAVGARVGYRTFGHLRRLLLRLGVAAGDLPIHCMRGWNRWGRRARAHHGDFP